MKSILNIIILSVLLASCLPQESARLRSLSTDADIIDSDSSGEDSVAGGAYEPPFWYDSGYKYTTLTIDWDNTKNHYLFGSDINSYLSASSNYQATYCVFIPFPNTAGAKPLLVRGTPAISTNYATGVKTRYLRVGLSSSSGNDFCKKMAKESEASTPVDFGAIDVALTQKNVCTNCLNIISSSEIKIYKAIDPSTLPGDEYLLKVPTTHIPYSSLRLRVDMNGNSSGNTPSCTDTACKIQGFSCCMDGQCVNEGNVKTGSAQSDPDGFALAELEKLTNPKWYLNYPQFYYICLEDPGTGDGADELDPADPDADARARLEAMIADYNCVEELKTNSLSDPFHTDPIDESIPASTYTACEVSDSSGNMYYEAVMKRLYVNCGCSETENLDIMVRDCPAYTYKLVYEQDSLGNAIGDPTSVACVTPPNNDNDLPFQDLEVMLNSRSAPHRFFNEDGEELNLDDAATLTGSTDQEGDPFQYLDDDKLFPLNGSYNMNSILGQMTVALDQARPAKMVKLEFDKVYYIAALEGSYTSCPSCSKDSWFTNFSPYPTTPQGLGVRASGFTTSRDSWGTNSSFANYEDAIFGRACWVPPTMLAFSHSTGASAQGQRLARLKTQAAMYVNGYQRDWYGFNRGAIIGSFDGVTWFAIGKGRKVRATSDRLYLAINAPFADLASPTDHTVSVQEYDFITTAAEYDYHPDLEINSPFQNEAGLCQKYHECETDSHCITKLGWEYSCVDVYQYQTKWPSFNSTGASEVAGDERTGAIAQFLQQGELVPGTSSKKCVYRGAGAPCRVDIASVTNPNTRRALACAPNFYCASVSSSDFNAELARYGNSLESIPDSKNHLYGQDANVLGRPKDYVLPSGGSSLPSAVQNAIVGNLQEIDSTTSNFGLCRPAKSLPALGGVTGTYRSDQLEQQQYKDAQARTDFISQIAGCNSSLRTDLKYASCPMLGADGNYVHLSEEYFNIAPGLEMSITDTFGTWTFDSRAAVTKYYSTQQNMCGLEAIDKNVNISSMSEESQRSHSAFKSIEARSLASSDVQILPTLVQNACFRRAGSVCHTNYDCSPNYKHYEIIDILHPDLFGNVPERKFWEEYLVCSQEDREPILTTGSDQEEIDAFNEYTMHNNRCCREVGKELTIYTEDSPSAPESSGLRTDVYGGFRPNDSSRYSRFAASLPQVDATTLEGRTSAVYTSRVSAKNPNNVSSATEPSILTENQWKNIHDTAARTCCGGSWVRKFADGTNDWSRDRLSLDVNNFKCLNYKTPLALTENATAYGLDQNKLSNERKNFCVDSGLSAAGCAQYSIDGIDDFSTKRAPQLNEVDGYMQIDSNPSVMKSLWSSNPWSLMQFISLDAHPDTFLNWDMPKADVINEAERQMIFTFLPSFIPFNEIQSITMDHPTNNTEITCSSVAHDSTWSGLQEYTNVSWTVDDGAPGTISCYYIYEPTSRLLKLAYSDDDIQNAANYDQGKSLSMNITFTAPGSRQWEVDHAAGTVADDTYIDHRRSSVPGNALYYLEKLAKLEYIGIPQMAYEPIFCNDIYQNLVPGIFNSSIKTASDFIGHPDTFTDPSTSTYWAWDAADPLAPDTAWSGDEMKKVADQKLLAHEQIFSDNEFKCCLPLGAKLDESESASVCCSGTRKETASSTSAGNTYTCALPDGTDLNVYFNKFVSGEGLSAEYLTTAQPLSVADFDARTGAPITDSTVISKLTAIGQELCASGAVARGAAYGPFEAEPVGSYEPQDGEHGPVNGFVDSVNDSGTINNRNVGYPMFQQGYRWNHHVYCAPES